MHLINEFNWIEWVIGAFLEPLVNSLIGSIVKTFDFYLEMYYSSIILVAHNNLCHVHFCPCLNKLQ